MQQTGVVLNSVRPSGTWCLTCLHRCCDHIIPRPGQFLEVWYYLHLPWQSGGGNLIFQTLGMYHPAARSTQDSSSFQLDCTALTQAPVLKLRYQYSLFHTICKALYVSEVSDVQVISCSQDGDACPRTLHFLEFAIPGLNAVVDWGSNA